MRASPFIPCQEVAGGGAIREFKKIKRDKQKIQSTRKKENIREFKKIKRDKQKIQSTRKGEGATREFKTKMRGG